MTLFVVAPDSLGRSRNRVKISLLFYRRAAIPVILKKYRVYGIIRIRSHEVQSFIARLARLLNNCFIPPLLSSELKIAQDSGILTGKWEIFLT